MNIICEKYIDTIKTPKSGRLFQFYRTVLFMFEKNDIASC